ncbi:hypothetical protein [Hoeflea sp.]|uniref:hypothetical protein n=1 Tax=Hoeflea sp. TaxID=1940281 RepID=UPI003B021BED
MVSNRSEDGARVKIEQTESEIIWMLSFNLVGIELFLREVLQILCDDDIGSPPDRCCQNMPIVSIGKRQAIDQRLEPDDQRIGEMPIHGLPGSLELIGT